MYLPAIKFIIDSIGTVSPTPNGLHHFLEIILRKPAKTDEFNDAKYPDDFFQCSVWNQKIEELPVLEVGDKVEVLINYQGRKRFDENKGAHYITKQFSIQRITKL